MSTLTAARLGAALRKARALDQVRSALEPHVATLFGREATLDAIDGYRIHPAKDEGYGVEYRVRVGGKLPAACSPNGEIALYGRIAPEREVQGVAITALDQDVVAFPHDPRLRALSRVLSSTEHEGVRFGLTGEATVVAWRPLTRATLRMPRSVGPPVFLRMSSSRERLARVTAAARVAESLSHDAPLFPRVAFEWPEVKAYALETAAGVTLDTVLEHADAATMARVAQALARLALAPLPPLARHHAIDEAEVTARLLRRALPVEPTLLASAQAELTRLFDLARDLPQGRATVVHRDLHDKQIVLTPDGGVTLLDPDTLALGDPALDAANFAAHLELRELQGRVPAGRGAELAEAFLAALRAAGVELDGARLAYFRACSLLRLAAVYALRPAPERLVPRLLERGRSALVRLSRSSSMSSDIERSAS